MAYKGACLSRLDRHEEAIPVLTRCINISEQLSEDNGLFLYRGDSYYGTKQYDEAVDDYKRAIEAEPDNGAAMDMCARSLFRAGEYGEALSMIKKAVEIRKSPEPFLVMSSMQMRLGMKQEEFKTMVRGASIFPEDKRFDDYRN